MCAKYCIHPHVHFWQRLIIEIKKTHFYNHVASYLRTFFYSLRFAIFQCNRTKNVGDSSLQSSFYIQEMSFHRSGNVTSHEDAYTPGQFMPN